MNLITLEQPTTNREQSNMRCCLNCRGAKEEDIRQLLAKPVCMMTGEEFSLLLQHFGKVNSGSHLAIADDGTARVSAEVTPEYKKRYVYGVQGIAETFGCSIPTANRIKASGVIDDAITQVGRKIVVDPELAIQLVKEAKVKGKTLHNSIVMTLQERHSDVSNASFLGSQKGVIVIFCQLSKDLVTVIKSSCDS